MIFIVFFGLIAVIVIGLNILDNSNINKIEEYFKTKQCETIIHGKGQYQALCPNSIIVIENGFSVDTSKPKELILYKDIKDIKKEKKKLIVITDTSDANLEFKDQNSADEFYKKVQNKL